MAIQQYFVEKLLKDFLVLEFEKFETQAAEMMDEIIFDAKARCEAMGIPWKEDFIPEWIRIAQKLEGKK